jgi:hypothetical protein
MIKVKAIKRGFYDSLMRKVGEEFNISSEAHFSKSWMTHCPDQTPKATREIIATAKKRRFKWL